MVATPYLTLNRCKSALLSKKTCMGKTAKDQVFAGKREAYWDMLTFALQEFLISFFVSFLIFCIEKVSVTR